MLPPHSHPGPDLETLLRSRPAPRLRLQGLLYLLTCMTTFAAGAAGWQPLLLGLDDIGSELVAHWPRGLAYAAAVMAVLTAHEAGHFIAAWIHRIPATLPFFIPVPVLLTGTLGAVIALNRRFPLLADAQRRHAWEPRIGERAPRDLKGQCAVVVGLGPIGRNIATLLKALGMRVIGARRSAEPVAACDRTIAYDRLGEALPEADWLILCCPASPLTRGIANAAVFAAMPTGAHFVNVARGEIAVEADMIAALASGRLAGAYLDVFEHEPLDPASPLWDMPNVLISPHTASHSLGQNEAIFEIFLDNLARWRAGGKLRNDVDDLG